MPSVNATHRKRLARALAAQQGISYLAALDQVTKAATAGRLPARLDEAGMRAALRILTSPETAAAVGDPMQAAVQAVIQSPERRIAADPRDQHIYDLSAAYEAVTGKQGLVYISSPGSGKDRYVFGGQGGGHVCLGREEAVAHIYGLLTHAQPAEAARSTQSGAPVQAHGECQHANTEYRGQDGTYCTDCGEALASYRSLVQADAFHLEKSSLSLLRQVWQGRVTWERHGTRTPGFRFAIDNQPASDLKDIELRWLRDHDYLTHPSLAEGEEWTLVRTTEFGDDVLTVHGADRDKFRDGLPEGESKSTTPKEPGAGTSTNVVNFSDIQRCPISSLEASHYRADGSCRCVPEPLPQKPATVREVRPTIRRAEPKPGSNEAIRQTLEARARLSNRIAGWFKTQMHADPKPVRWTWVDKEGDKDSFSEMAVEYADGTTQFMFPGDLPDNATPLDPSHDRLMGGAYATKVADSRGRSVNAVCDVCNRRLSTDEPWWMVHSTSRGWENNTGVVCGMHHPDRLPTYTPSTPTHSG